MAQDAAGNSGSAVLTLQEGGGYQPPQPGYPGYPPSRKLNKEILSKICLFY